MDDLFAYIDDAFSWEFASNIMYYPPSDAKVRFWTDARTENRKNRTIGSGSVQFGPRILGCWFGSRFYDF